MLVCRMKFGKDFGSVCGKSNLSEVCNGGRQHLNYFGMRAQLEQKCGPSSSFPNCVWNASVG